MDHTLVGSRTLYVLPFNLLGNFRDPARLLQPLAARKVAGVISVFSDSAEATRVREAYYLRCGVQQLEHQVCEGGITFTGVHDFYSRSYTCASFHALLAECGLTIVKTRTNALAHCATVQLDAKT